MAPRTVTLPFFARRFMTAFRGAHARPSRTGAFLPRAMTQNHILPPDAALIFPPASGIMESAPPEARAGRRPKRLNFADLHIHSVYSDGTLTPERIVRIARESGVGLISVCDHNVVEGTLAAAKLAPEAGLRCIPGVEIDAIFRGADIHILCYGADLANPALLSRIRHARAMLDGMSAELLERMLPDYPQLSPAEYESFPHDSARGGWKMLQYLQARDVTPDLKAALPLYERYGVTYAGAGFDPAEDVISAIHAAEGRAVLAHPGVTFPAEDLRALEAWVEAAFDLGLDGVECHYPRHSPGVTWRLIEICRRRGAMITAGSDCHGAFNRSEIGQTRTPISELQLNGLALS